jgi:hypothetical protein
MSWHEVWHVTVLTSTLLGAAGGLLLLIAPLVFGTTPEGLKRGRPWVVGLVMLALVLLAIEWLIVHGGD